MARMGTMREAAKADWESRNTDQDLTLGCLQRIADNTEAMAKSYKMLIEERNWLKEAQIRDGRWIQKLKHRMSGLRGAFTRLKRKSGGMA